MYTVAESEYIPANCSVNDLGWLVGCWQAQPSPTKTMTIMANWTIGGKFIRCNYETADAKGSSERAALIIGQDPSNGKIVSWHFDASGGFGSGSWLYDGDTCGRKSP